MPTDNGPHCWVSSGDTSYLMDTVYLRHGKMISMLRLTSPHSATAHLLQICGLGCSESGRLSAVGCFKQASPTRSLGLADELARLARHGLGLGVGIGRADEAWKQKKSKLSPVGVKRGRFAGYGSGSDG